MGQKGYTGPLVKVYREVDGERVLVRTERTKAGLLKRRRKQRHPVLSQPIKERDSRSIDR
jgi:hypothetical protein